MDFQRLKRIVATGKDLTIGWLELSMPSENWIGLIDVAGTGPGLRSGDRVKTGRNQVSQVARERKSWALSGGRLTLLWWLREMVT